MNQFDVTYGRVRSDWERMSHPKKIIFFVQQFSHKSQVGLIK